MPEKSIKTGVWGVCIQASDGRLHARLQLQSKANLAIVILGSEFPKLLKYGVSSFPNASGDPSLISKYLMWTAM